MKRKAGRIISIILSLILLSGLLPEGLTIRVYAGEPSGDPGNGIELNGTTYQWTDNVYVNKNAEVSISNRVKVSGDVILMLEKDTVLNCTKGIHVPEGSCLTIEGEGKLIATSENYLTNRAGIGGNLDDNCGSITINGGIIEATGYQGGAGIGGGKNGSGGTIIINKGEITARGGVYAAGIGGGNEGSAGTIEINGGSVVAIGGDDAAGIGCGKCGSGGTITVNDGTVTASGGSWGAGIGSGETDDDSGKVSVIINNGMITANGGNHGAGIGSGALNKSVGNGNGYGYEVLIYGGTVIATGGSYGAGIGSGAGQIVTSSIKIYGGKIKATGGSDEGGPNAAGIGAGNGGTGENILLSWSDPEDDYIESDSYKGDISFGEYTRFKLQDSDELATKENIGGKRIIPFLGDLHSITTKCSAGGSVRTDSDKSSAGQKVNISWNVEYPYDFKSVAVTAGESNVNTDGTGEGSASFIMPDRDVEVSVVFERIDAVSRETSEGTKSCDPVLPQKNEYSSGWYTINRDVSISNRISIIGDVKLFLPEGKTLSCLDGITVAEGNRLTIEGTGKLIATDNYVNAAIGGLRDGSTGSIIIKSGIVEATANNLAAGIGGGYNGGSGKIVIEGGTVKAVGGTYTGAIGCGNNGSGGSIQISGGKVSAIGGPGGIGIGGDNVTVELGWTGEEDEIYANAYSGNVSFISGKYFKLKGTNEAATIENIGGSCIVPNSSDAHDISIVAAPYGSIRYLAGEGNHQAVLDKAPAGAKLFVSYNCDYPYEFTGISVTDTGGGDSVTITKVSDYVYSFIMPDHPIKLTALYTETKPVEMMTSEGLKACMPVRPYYTVWDKEEWYVLTEDVTFADDNITVKGDIKLLLMENATLTIHGYIDVKKDNSLTIEGKGSLNVDASDRDHVPGIGGGGNIIIRGGNITSKGGFCAAGIGGEHSVIGSGLSGNSGNITIEGGTVTAVGGYNAAGIGSNFRELCGDICISGGIVTATGGCKGAGIGGGYYAPSGNISISGGTVTANGGLDAAGIGGGFANMYTGYDQPGGEILISGGKVTATGGGSDAMGSDSEGYGAGIGGGAYGNCREITITGGQVTAVGNARTDWSSAPYQQVHSAGIGNGWKGTADGDIVLGWTNEEDYIDSTSFGGNISFAEGKEFYLADGVTAASPENIISGTKLAPAVSRSIVIADGKRSYTKIFGDAGFYLEGISSVPAGADFTFSVTDSRNISGENAADDRIITVSSDGRVTIHGAGSAKIAVSASGTATVYIEVSIQKKAVTPAVTVNGSYSYTGSAIIPTVTVKESDEANAQVLTQNDYSVAATDNVHAGRGTLKISAGANGNYSFDAVTKEFEIGRGTAEAPTGITTVAETMMGKADGEICGLSTKMEYAYSADGDTWPSVYTGCPGTVLRNAKAGKYRIRYKENSDLLASEYAAVIVEAGESAEIKIEILGKVGEITVTAKDVAGKTYDLTNGITKEDSEEKYTMANLPYGFYNITVRHTVGAVTKTSTVLVETTERSVSRNLLVLKPGDNESVVDTTDLTGLPEVGSVLVGGLEDEAKGLTDGSGQKAKDNKITIEIKSGGTETIASNDAEKAEKQAIVDRAGEVYGNAETTKAAFLEINVKQTQENGELVKNLTQLNKVLELLIPYNFNVGYDVRLWRSHTGEAAKQLTALASKPTGSFVDGTYYIDKAHGRIFVYGSRYSVYALTYTTEECFEVSFDPAGGSPVAKQSVKKNSLVMKPADPTRNGYTFNGWYSGDTAWDFDSNTVTSDLELTAKWTEKATPPDPPAPTRYTLTVTNGTGSGSYTAGTPVTIRANDPESGKRFKEWTGAEELTFTAGSAKSAEATFTMPAKAVTVAASYEDIPENAFTVSFDLNGKPGTAPPAQIVEKDGTAKMPADPLAEGFSFTGWYTESDCRTKYDFAAPVTADITLYAGWLADEPIMIEDCSDWNLYEDASDHEYTIHGISVNGTVENSNVKSGGCFDAKVSGSTITVKLTGDRKKAASNAALEFDLGRDGVIEYILPVSYVKPCFKLSSATATIKTGTMTVLRTRVLVKNADGSYEPYDMTDVTVSGTGLGSVTKAEDGSIEIKTSAAGKGKISIVKDSWDGAKAVNLAYTVKESQKDVLSVDLGGLKTVVLNSNEKGQVFDFDVSLNGAVPAEGAVKIVDRKNTGLASVCENGKLTIAYKEGVKNGTYTITLQAGEAKTRVKVRVSGKEPDKAISLKLKRKYDVVTKQPMVVVPTLKDVSGRIEAVSVAEEGFTARLNAAGNIVIDYSGDAYDAKNLNIGTLTLTVKISGVEEAVKLTMNNVKAKKTTPKVKLSAVTIPAEAEAAEGKVIGSTNIVSTYKLDSGKVRLIKPVKVEIAGTPKGVTAKVNDEDMTEIDVYSISKKNATVKVKLTYAGGVTKTVTMKLNKK